jgi:hypothetical protein
MHEHDARDHDRALQRFRRGAIRFITLCLPALGLAAATTAVCLDAAEVDAAPSSRRIETISVDDIKPGMKGHAVTVFSGTQSDRFEIEVLDIKRDYQTGQDAVFFRSSDPRLEHSGIVGGMSGSPIYIDGKLAGALAYGYRFNKDPIGGMTPISNMLEIDKLPYRPDVIPQPKVRARSRAGTDAWADQMLGLGMHPLPPRRRPDDLPDARGVRPRGLDTLEVPVSVGGLSPQAADYLSDMLDMPVLSGPSGGRSLLEENPPKKQWKPGDSVSVVLIAGDNSSGANGTVTWVGGKKGERLLAFGHPLAQTGPSRLPIADARVHVIIPSVQRSMKLSSPLTIQGTMVQDRQPAIALRTDVHSPMIPVTTTVQSPEPNLPTRRYESKVADSSTLTGALATSLLISSVTEAGNDAVELTLKTRHKISIRTTQGARTVELEEETFFPQGVLGGMIARGRAVSLLGAMSDNPFEVVEIRSIEQEATLEYGAPSEDIEKITLASGEVRAGGLAQVDVVLKSHRGERRTQRIAIRVPQDVGDQKVVLQIAGGDWVRPYRPMPETIDDLIDNVAATYPTRSLVASVYRGEEGLSTNKGLLSDLPPSVLSSLSSSGSSEGSVHFKQVSRRVIQTKNIIDGDKRLEVNVLPPRKL